MSASLELARSHMQNMQTSEFLHLLGPSSVSAVSWDVFRGGWHRTAISGILLWQGGLSRAGDGGCYVGLFVFLCNFLYLPGRPFRIDLFDIPHFLNFNEILFRLPDVANRSKNVYWIILKKKRQSEIFEKDF